MRLLPDYKIRLATEDDWPGIYNIENSRYGTEGYSGYFIRMIPILFRQSCWVAEVGQLLVGYCLSVREDLSFKTGWIFSVVVREGYEDMGIGTALCKMCVIGLKELGVQSIKLTVAPDNSKAIHVYKKLGFHVSEQQIFFLLHGRSSGIDEASKAIIKKDLERKLKGIDMV